MYLAPSFNLGGKANDGNALQVVEKLSNRLSWKHSFGPIRVHFATVCILFFAQCAMFSSRNIGFEDFGRVARFFARQ